MAKAILQWKQFGTVDDLKTGKLDKKEFANSEEAIYMYLCTKSLKTSKKVHIYKQNPLYIGRVYRTPLIEVLKDNLLGVLYEEMQEICAQDIRIRVASVKTSTWSLRDKFSIIEGATCCLVHKTQPVLNTYCKTIYSKDFDMEVINKGYKQPFEDKYICKVGEGIGID